MKKCLIYGRLILMGILVIPFFLSCVHTEFYDRNISMKESCIVEYDEVVSLIINDEVKGEYIEPVSLQGKKMHIIPAGIYTFAYSSTTKEPIDAKNRSDEAAGRSYWYTWRTETVRSDSITLEVGKRYKLERAGKKFIVKEIDKTNISSNGVVVVPRSAALFNAFGWRYNDMITMLEVGPQIGLSILSDPMIINITGEATIGFSDFFLFQWIFSNNEKGYFGLPYRLGGSVTTYFGKSRIGLGLGGGITGQTVYWQGDEMVPVKPVPYIQAKANFRLKNVFTSYGLYFDYYPTVVPTDIGSFGFGFTVNSF